MLLPLFRFVGDGIADVREDDEAIVDVDVTRTDVCEGVGALRWFDMSFDSTIVDLSSIFIFVFP